MVPPRAAAEGVPKAGGSGGPPFSQEKVGAGGTAEGSPGRALVPMRAVSRGNFRRLMVVASREKPCTDLQVFFWSKTDLALNSIFGHNVLKYLHECVSVYREMCIFFNLFVI